MNTVIFDIDGLLIDSEPLWNAAAAEVFESYGVQLTDEQYKTTTGLRSKEFINWWFSFFNLPASEMAAAEKKVIELVLVKIDQQGNSMPGIPQIFQFFKERNYQIGLATSSPPALIHLVTKKLKIEAFIQASSSAEGLPFGKPHPQVYLDCAHLLNANPTNCLCFEDSFNGLIAAKAARMKCVVVPTATQFKDPKWGAADLTLASLAEFNDQHLAFIAQ